MLLTIRAIVTDLREKRSLVVPHVVQHVADKITGDGDDGNEVTLARRLAGFDALVHLLVAGHPTAEKLSYIDGSVAISRAVLTSTGADVATVRARVNVGEPPKGPGQSH